MKIFSLFFLLFLNQSLSYTFTNLTAEDSPTFNQDVAKWTVNSGTPASPSNTQYYDVHFYLGKFYGYITSFERTYTNLPSHDSITFTIMLHIGGAWAGIVSTFYFDSVSINSPKFFSSNDGISTGPILYKGAVSHQGATGSSLSLRIVPNSAFTGINGMERIYFGMRNLYLYFHGKDYTGSTSTPMCQTSTARSPMTDQCACNMNQGLNSATGACESCALGCGFCSGPALDQCLTCNSTTSQGWNGTRCVLKCDAACSDCYGFSPNECTACQPGYFNYENGTCLQSTCPYPFVKTVQGSQTICKNPCENPSDFYFEEDGFCQSTCPYPYTVINSPSSNKLCQISLSPDDENQADKIAQSTDKMNSGISGAIKVASLFNSGDSTSAGISSITKMLQYIKFMNVGYPAKVEGMFRHQNSRDSFSLNLTSFLDEFPNTPAHRKYAFYNVSSSFFVNYWSDFVTLSIIFLAILLFMALEFCVKKSGKLHSIIITVLSAFRWNAFLIIFSGSTGDIIFFTALDLQTKNISNFYPCLSFIVCILANILSIFVLFKILSTNWTLQKAKKTSPKDLETQANLLKNFKALFDPYQNSSYPQQIFLFLFILRVSFANGIIGYFYNYPVFQALCLVIFSLVMITYLIIKRPFKLVINLIQQIVLEICLLVANFCVFFLAVMDSKEIIDVSRRESIAQIIINLNLAVPVISLILLTAKFLLLGVTFYKSWKAEKKKLPEKIAHRIQGPPMNVKLQSNRADFPRRSIAAEMVSIPIGHDQSPSFSAKQTRSSSLMDSSYLQNYSNDTSVLDKLNLSNVSEANFVERRKPRIKKRFKNVREFREYVDKN